MCFYLKVELRVMFFIFVKSQAVRTLSVMLSIHCWDSGLLSLTVPLGLEYHTSASEHLLLGMVLGSHHISVQQTFTEHLYLTGMAFRVGHESF